MLYGIDISNWNDPGKSTYKLADFMLHKASEGLSYKDKKRENHVASYKEVNTDGLLGFYHFGRPDKGNSPIAEANNFLSCVEPYIGNAVLALDLESGNEHYPEWALSWLTYVERETGVKPMIYTSASFTKYLASIGRDTDFGLWVANYKRNGNEFPKVKPEKIYGWKFWAIWQWSNGQTPYESYVGVVPNSVDMDIFNGDRDAWIKYCRPNKPTPEPECRHCTIHCPEA